MPDSLFNIDQLAGIMMLLVGVVAATTAAFAARYMAGDKGRTRFFVTLFALVCSVFLYVSANHLLILLLAWFVSNLLLSSLMIHKNCWSAARASGLLAARNFLLGMLFVSVSFVLLYSLTGAATVQGVLQAEVSGSGVMIISLLFLILGAMVQSAIWPFHRWLTSSLNSPTPVSALMHAGLVNGGGFLLARFAPLYIERPVLLQIIFIVGMVTAVLGTLWKLMQNDIKRMLGCSTMGQMGFMFVQCGLGLFPAAVAHLCWHGFFKAYLFLSSGSAAQGSKIIHKEPPSAAAFAASLLCGVVGACMFTLASGKSFTFSDTTFVLIFLAGIAGTQLALSLLFDNTLLRLPVALPITAAAGGAYGLSVGLVNSVLKPVGLMQPQPVNVLHAAGLLMLTAAWLTVVFGRNKLFQQPGQWLAGLYVRALNASQPHPSTITAYRNDYKYL